MAKMKMKLDGGRGDDKNRTKVSRASFFNAHVKLIVTKMEHFTRSKVNYTNLCFKFYIKEKNYNVQYYPYYNCRLSKMFKYVEENCLFNWSNDYKIVKLSQLSEMPNEKVIIIGILFKHMQLQPTILKEISEDNQLIEQPVRDRYIEDQDFCMIQDERESVKLIGNLNIHSHVTGIIIGLLGFSEDNGNQFVVEDYCYSSLPQNISSIERPFMEEDKFIILVSGFGFAKQSPPELTNARQIFSDFITGMLTNQDAKRSAKIVKIIIAGNLISTSKSVKNETNVLSDKNSATKSWFGKTKVYSVDLMKMIDNFLLELGKSIELDIMPGETDVTSSMIPQQPFHPCTLPKSSVLTSVRCITNPYLAQFDNLLVLGTSGQNIKSIGHFSQLEDPLEIMEMTLQWRHLAPTAPDTMFSYPYPDQDPFIIEKMPHIYFSGNQPVFNTKLKYFNNQQQIVRMVTVPSFEQNYSCVMINLKNLDCELLAFS